MLDRNVAAGKVYIRKRYFPDKDIKYTSVQFYIWRVLQRSFKKF